MEETFNKPSKLRILKLSKLLTDESVKIKHKTERNHERFNHKIYNINNINTFGNTQKYFHFTTNRTNVYNNTIYNNNRLDIIKKKPNKSNLNLPFILNAKKKKNKYNSGNKNTSISGYNNYLKIKSNKVYMRMNRLLMEETLKRLSMPKFRRAKRGERIFKEKSKSFGNEILFEDDFYDEQKDKRKKNIKNSKTNKNLFEKEKIKLKTQFTYLLKKNFRKLDSCEKKFDFVIEKTMKILSDYGISLSYLKKEEQNLDI